MSRRDGKRPPGGGSGPSGDGTEFRGGGSHILHSIAEVVPKLINAACNIPDVDEGRSRLAELMGSAFRAKFGAEMAGLERQIAHETAKLLGLEAELEAAKAELAVTPEWVPASQVNHGRDAADHVETEWADWQVRHRVEARMILLALPVALAASAFTAHANLVGTGLPVMIEQPLVPWAMAALAPMASLAVKSMGSLFRTSLGKGLFTYTLNGAAAVSIGLWILSFSDQFHGLSPNGLGGDIFAEPSIWQSVKDTGFVALTLTTELLIGSVLAHRLERLGARYSPDYWLRNLDHERLAAKVETLQAQVDALSEHLAGLEGEREAFDESLNLQVRMATMAYDGRRGRADDIL